jgi:hypothetical protein
MGPYSVQCRMCGTRVKITTFAREDQPLKTVSLKAVVLCSLCQGSPSMVLRFQRDDSPGLGLGSGAAASRLRHRPRAS